MTAKKDKTQSKALDDDALYLLKRVCRAWFDMAGPKGNYTEGNEDVCLGAVANLAQHMQRTGLRF